MWRQLYTLTRRVPLLKSLVWRWLPVAQAQVDGLTFELHPRDNMTERQMWLTGAFPEAASIDLLSREVASGPVLVLDIGANAGAFTLPLARALGPGSRLIALEPNPDMAARLRRNLGLSALTDRVDLREAALGAARGEATLTLHIRNLGQSSLGHVGRPGRTITVPTVPFGDLLREATPDQRIIVKIDIEGYEDRALWPFLSAPDAPLPGMILIEVQGSHNWQHDLPARLLALGYQPRFEGDGNRLYALPEAA